MHHWGWRIADTLKWGCSRKLDSKEIELGSAIKNKYPASVLPSSFLSSFPAIIKRKITFQKELVEIVIHTSLWIAAFLTKCWNLLHIRDRLLDILTPMKLISKRILCDQNFPLNRDIGGINKQRKYVFLFYR